MPKKAHADLKASTDGNSSELPSEASACPHGTKQSRQPTVEEVTDDNDSNRDSECAQSHTTQNEGSTSAEQLRTAGEPGVL